MVEEIEEKSTVKATWPSHRKLAKPPQHRNLSPCRSIPMLLLMATTLTLGIGEKPLLPACHDRYANSCLLKAFRNLGVNCRYSKGGPLWALEDGNEILRPHGQRLRHVNEPMSSSGLRYVVNMQGHFMAVRTFKEDFDVIVNDEFNTSFLGDVSIAAQAWGKAATWYVLEDAVIQRSFPGLPIAICLEINQYLAPVTAPEMLHRVPEGGPVTYPLLGGRRSIPFISQFDLADGLYTGSDSIGGMDDGMDDLHHQVGSTSSSSAPAAARAPMSPFSMAMERSILETQTSATQDRPQD